MKKIPPSKYLAWVIHLDGMETQHDIAVNRKGVWKKAMAASKLALESGYRVCSNTTLFRGSNAGDLHQLFTLVTDMGFEGVMVSAGYDFVDGPVQEMFLSRKESIEVFRRVLTDDAMERIRFYNNPLYLRFLRGERDYQCTAWSNPTYTVQGWREPCYPLADRHTENVDDLFSSALWERLRRGRERQVRQLHDALRVRVGDGVRGIRQPQGRGVPGEGACRQSRQGRSQLDEWRGTWLWSLRCPRRPGES